MEKVDELIVDFKPLNYYWQTAVLLFNVSIVFVGGWLLFYITSDEERREYLTSHIGFTLLCFLFFLLIALLQIWLTGKIYIYKLVIDDGIVFIKWQEWKKFKEISISVKSINASLIPYGKNNPYLLMEIIDGNQIIKLKQYAGHAGWTRELQKQIIEKISDTKNFNV